MVEAPGTAPGSDRFITISIYRHSWRTSPPNIDRSPRLGKTNEHELVKRSNEATPKLDFHGQAGELEGERAPLYHPPLIGSIKGGKVDRFFSAGAAYPRPNGRGLL